MKLSRNIFWLRVLAVILITASLARPQLEDSDSKRTVHGIDIVLTVDISSSMLAEDLGSGVRHPNRLEAAKKVIGDFIRARENDRIGIVVFAARPYTLSPLTLDHDWLLRNLARVEAAMIDDGTSIGEGIIASLNRIRGKDNRGKVVILLTDGRNNAGTVPPLVAAEAARALGIKVYTVGAGSGNRAVFPVTGPFGNTVYREVNADIDETTLKAIAAGTGAVYFRATDAAALGKIYRQIDLLEQRPLEEKVRKSYHEIFGHFLMASILLLLLEFILKCTMLRRVP